MDDIANGVKQFHHIRLLGLPRRLVLLATTIFIAVSPIFTGCTYLAPSTSPTFSGVVRYHDTVVRVPAELFPAGSATQLSDHNQPLVRTNFIKVTSVEVENGQKVKKGDVLARLDDRLDESNKLLELTVVKAPVNGLITGLRVHAGESLAAMSRLLLIRRDQPYVDIFVPTGQLSSVSGKTPFLSLDSLPGSKFRATLQSRLLFYEFPPTNAQVAPSKVFRVAKLSLKLPRKSFFAAGIPVDVVFNKSIGRQGGKK